MNLTFIGPCIVIYSYSTTNKMHQFLKLFILETRSTYFGRSFLPSSGAQNCTYGNRHMSNSCWYLLLAGTKWNFLGQTAASRCEGFPTCQALTPSPSPGSYFPKRRENITSWRGCQRKFSLHCRHESFKTSYLLPSPLLHSAVTKPGKYSSGLGFAASAP